jgi:methylthioribose-1-phosphate isomerase
MFKTIEWTERGVRILDQTRLPAEEVYRTYTDYQGVAEAIRTMVIRGAPAIGVAAAMGVALGVQNSRASTASELRSDFDRIASTLSQTRPTAVNLFWAIRRMRAALEEVLARERASPAVIAAAKQRLVDEAQRILAEDVAVNQAIGRHGAALLQNVRGVLTHCNAGALATAGYGTALGVIRAAVAAGQTLHVFADETRPFLQGARLTAWELAQDQIPVTLITDNMAGHFMQRGHVQAVVVGADRIAANGDVANKIGTYTLAVLAKENQIPFYVAAPTSTIDLSIPSGEQIPIEQRPSDEVKQVAGVRVAPPGVEACNPAFDVTPHRYVTAIITERGVIREPYAETLPALCG